MVDQLSEQHRGLRDAAREFARTAAAPGADGRDGGAVFPYELIAELGQRRWMGIPFAAEHGGLGADTLAFVLAIEELAAADAALAAAVSAHTLQGTMPVHLWGTAEQKARWLPWLCSGQRVAAFGSSPGAQPTRIRATFDAGSWKLDGAEHAVAGAGTRLSACLTATVVTGSADGRPELSTVIVPSNAPGYGIGPPHRSVGWRAVDIRPISFRGCEVEETALLGKRGAGLSQYLQIIDGNRIGLAAQSVGVAQAALDEARAEVTRRGSVSGALGAGVLEAAIGDLAPRIEVARQLTRQAALERDQGQPFALTAATARLAAGRVALTATEVAIQARGGFGQIEGGTAWRLFRDSRMLAAADGSEEMQEAVIGSAGGAGAEPAPGQAGAVAPHAPPLPSAHAAARSPAPAAPAEATAAAPSAAPLAPAVPAEGKPSEPPEPSHTEAGQGSTVQLSTPGGTQDPTPPPSGARTEVTKRADTPSGRLALAHQARAFIVTEAGLAVTGVGIGVLACLVLLASWRV